MKTARSILIACVSLVGLAFSPVASADVCPATNVVGIMQWVLTPSRATVEPEGTNCVASIRLKRSVPSPGIPSTVHYMKNGNVVKSIRMDIAGSSNEAVVINHKPEEKFDSVVVMANYN